MGKRLDDKQLATLAVDVRRLRYDVHVLETELAAKTADLHDKTRRLEAEFDGTKLVK